MNVKNFARNSLTASTALALLAGFPVFAAAQECDAERPVTADRPGTLGGPLIVPKGSVQIESGWMTTHSGRDNAHEIGATMVRVPLSCRVEVRLSSGGYEVDQAAGLVTTHGVRDALIAAKLMLIKGHGFVPFVSVFGGATVPVGGPLSHQHSEPEVASAAMWEFPKGHSVILYGRYANRAVAESRAWERLAGFNYMYAFNARVNGYVDVSQTAIDGGAENSGAAGLQLYPTKVFAIDLFMGAPLRASPGKTQLGIGFEHRF